MTRPAEKRRSKTRTRDTNMRILAPRIIDELLLMPRVNYFDGCGFRAEACFTGGERQAEAHTDTMRPWRRGHGARC